MAVRCIPLQQHSESGLQGIASATGDLIALADVTALTRLKLFDESQSALMLMVEEGGAYPISKKDFGVLDPVRLAREAEDLKGWIIRCNQIQSSIQQQKAVVVRGHGHGVLLWVEAACPVTPRTLTQSSHAECDGDMSKLNSGFRRGEWRSTATILMVGTSRK